MAKAKGIRKRRGNALVVIFLLLCVILALGVAAVYKVQNIFEREMDLIGTLERVDAPLPLYTIDISGDYYFHEFLSEHHGASSDKELSEFLTEKISHGFYKVNAETGHTACSVISAKDKDEAHVWGRNYDWGEPVAFIVRSRPEHGYASISTCDFTQITSDTDVLDFDTLTDKFMSLAAYYVPLDGVNEAGLCVADLQINEGGMTETFTERTDLTITTAIRLLLNEAATVEQAVELLGKYDIHPSGGISHHLAVSDASGNSVVLEFVEGRTEVVERHYVTNFTLFYDDTLAAGESAQKRYNTMRFAYRDDEGILSYDRIKDIMREVSQSEGSDVTRWTIVYGGKEKKLNYFFNRDFEHPYSFGFDF